MAKTAKANKPARDDSFEAVAKRLECDGDKDRFEARLGKIVRAKPKLDTMQQRKK